MFNGYSFNLWTTLGDSGKETDEEDIPSVLTDTLDSPAQPPRETEVVPEPPISDEPLAEPEPKTP